MDITERESAENIECMHAVMENVKRLGFDKKTDEAFATLRPFFEDNAVPACFVLDAGWVIYRYVKAHSATLLPSEVATFLGWYLSLCNHQPGVLHSYIMILAVNYKKAHMNDFSFVPFCRAWQLTSFRDDDYQETKSTLPDGKSITFQSLAVKAAVCLYKEIKQTQSAELSEEFMPFFRNLKQRCPGFKFTQLYIANMTAWSGHREQAADMLRAMLVTDQQWYLWKHLGDLLSGSVRLSCYCKAVCMCDNDNYTVEIHLAIADMLAATDSAQAAYDLRQYSDTFRRNGWRIRRTAEELLNRLQGVAPSAEGSAFYAAHCDEAEEYAFSGQPKADFAFCGVTTNNAGKRRAKLVCLSPKVTVYAPLSAELRKARPGDVLNCTYHAGGHRYTLLAVHFTGRKTNVAQNAERKNGNIVEASGTVHIKDGQSYAFVDKYYISPKLRQNASLKDGQRIKVQAEQEADGRWRVVKIMMT